MNRQAAGLSSAAHRDLVGEGDGDIASAEQLDELQAVGCADEGGSVAESLRRK